MSELSFDDVAESLDAIVTSSNSPNTDSTDSKEPVQHIQTIPTHNNTTTNNDEEELSFDNVDFDVSFDNLDLPTTTAAAVQQNTTPNFENNNLDVNHLSSTTIHNNTIQNFGIQSFPPYEDNDNFFTADFDENIIDQDLILHSSDEERSDDDERSIDGDDDDNTLTNNNEIMKTPILPKYLLSSKYNQQTDANAAVVVAAAAANLHSSNLSFDLDEDGETTNDQDDVCWDQTGISPEEYWEIMDKIVNGEYIFDDDGNIIEKNKKTTTTNITDDKDKSDENEQKKNNNNVNEDNKNSIDITDKKSVKILPKIPDDQPNTFGNIFDNDIFDNDDDDNKAKDNTDTKSNQQTQRNGHKNGITTQEQQQQEQKEKDKKNQITLINLNNNEQETVPLIVPPKSITMDQLYIDHMKSLKLFQVKFNLMFDRQVLYIRGRRAIVTCIDYPLIFWRYVNLYTELSYALTYLEHDFSRSNVNPDGRTLSLYFYIFALSTPDVGRLVSTNEYHASFLASPCDFQITEEIFNAQISAANAAAQAAAQARVEAQAAEAQAAASAAAQAATSHLPHSFSSEGWGWDSNAQDDILQTIVNDADDEGWSDAYVG